MRNGKQKIKLLGKNKNIFKFIFLRFKALFYREDVFHAPGSHLITAYPGGGKTLKMNQIINEVDREKYFFLSNIKEFDGVKSFDILDMFKNGEQVKRFPTVDDKGRKIYGVVFDEINLNFNRRMNRTKEYNEAFVGLIEFVVSHRHQDIPRIYFIGQKLDLQDTQLQSLFVYWHDIIKKKQRYKYWYYYKYSFCKIPVKLTIENWKKCNNEEYQFLNKQKHKISERDLTTYNTKALAENYKNLDCVKLT